MGKRILTREQILSIVELKKTMKVHEVATKLNITVSAIRYWIRRLKDAGHTIKKIKSVQPIDLTIKEDDEIQV